MKFTTANGSILGGIIKFVLCVLLGIVIAIGGEVLGVYLLITKDGSVGKVEEAANKYNVKVDFDDETAQKSLLEWGKGLVSSLSNISSGKIGDLEKTLGINSVSDAINSFTGIDKQTIKDSSLGDIGKTVSDNMTLSSATDKFGIGLPDMPLFQDETFLGTPLSSAFSTIDANPINKFITIDASSNKVLQELATTPIKDLGGTGANEKIMSMLVCEVMTIDPATASEAIKAIMYCSLESQYVKDENGEFVLDGNGQKQYKTKVINAGTPEEKTVQLIGITEKMNDIAVKEVITIDETSSVFLRKMRKPTEAEVTAGKGSLFGAEDVLVNDMSTKITDIINSVVLCEMMDIGEDSSSALKALKYACIESQYVTDENGEPVLDEHNNKIYKETTIIENGIAKDVPLIGFNEKLKEMCVKDVITIDENSNAVLRKLRAPTAEETAAGKAGLFGTEDVKLEELGTKMQSVVDETTIGEIIGEDDGNRPNILKALENTKIKDMDTRVGTLTLAEIFGEEDTNSGVLSLIPATTTLNEIPAVMTSTMTNSNIATLSGTGIIEVTASTDTTPKEQKSFLFNSTIGNVVNGMIAFINDPITASMTYPYYEVKYDNISPVQKTVSVASFSSLESFIAAYTQYSTIILTTNVTVNIAASDAKYLVDGAYVMPIFNFKNNGYTLSFTDGGAVTPKVAVFEQNEGAYVFNNGKAALSKNQYGYCYNDSGTANYTAYAATIEFDV